MTRLIAALPALAGALALGFSDPAVAQVLYDNGPHDGQNGYDLSNYVLASDFSLASPASVTSVQFWTIENSEGSYGAFYWAIYSDLAGQPGALIQSGENAAAVQLLGPWGSGLSLWHNDMAIGAVGLGAGTFWLALHNGPLTHLGSGVFWATAALNGTAPFRGDFYGDGSEGNWFDGDFTEYTNDSSELAFAISGVEASSTVPEPVSLLLLGTGLAGAGAIRRRTRDTEA